MAAEEEDQIKICGLCSQFVDESVMINAQMKTFLMEFLQVSEEILPAKTCVECFKLANDCKRFKEACKKTFVKLKKNKISQNLILGTDKNSAKLMKNLKSAATEPSKKNKILESLGLDPDKIDIDVTSVRSSRSSKPAPKGKKSKAEKSLQCRVIIKQSERDQADRHWAFSGAVKSTRKRPAAPTPTAQPPPKKAKKAPQTPTPAPAPLPAKRQTSARRSAVSTGEEKNADKNVSKFGRTRKSPARKGYVYGDELNSEVSPEVKSSSTTPKTPAKEIIEPPKAVEEVVEESDEDTEEYFPSIGPYQCEICQIITDTKVEFVSHIKEKHADVVDEEVLQSLESDLRKSKKKQGKEGKPAKEIKPVKKPSAPAKAKKANKPGPASKKTAKKPSENSAKKGKKAPKEIIVEDDPLGINGTNTVDDTAQVVMENAEEDHVPELNNSTMTKIAQDPFDELNKGSGWSNTNGISELLSEGIVENTPVVVEPINDIFHI